MYSLSPPSHRQMARSTNTMTLLKRCPVSGQHCPGHKCQRLALLSNATCHLCSSHVWLLLGDFQKLWRHYCYDSFHLICPPMVSMDSSSFLLAHLTCHPYSSLGEGRHLSPSSHGSLVRGHLRITDPWKVNRNVYPKFPACQAMTACLLSPELCSCQ